MTDAATYAATVAGLSPVETTKPTPIAERTLAGALIALWMLAIILTAALVVPHWDPKVEGSIIHYLGIGLLGTLLGVGLLIGAFASPWCGSIRMSAMGAEMDINQHRGGDNG